MKGWQICQPLTASAHVGPGLLLERPLEPRREQGALRLGEVATFQVPIHDERDERAAFVPGFDLHGDAELPAGAVAMAAVHDPVPVEDDGLALAVGGDRRHKARELRVAHLRQEVGGRVEFELLDDLLNIIGRGDARTCRIGRGGMSLSRHRRRRRGGHRFGSCRIREAFGARAIPSHRLHRGVAKIGMGLVLVGWLGAPALRIGTRRDDGRDRKIPTFRDPLGLAGRFDEIRQLLVSMPVGSIVDLLEQGLQPSLESAQGIHVPAAHADHPHLGDEIASLASLFAKDYAVPGANLYFCHSATEDGRAIGQILAAYYRRAGHPIAAAVEIDDLQDEDPTRFRTRGLRNLAKAVCRIIRDHGAPDFAINATGGYKAQIAIAVLMGQSLGVPVYYKHERFDEIIAFPPLPVALDFQAWMRLSGLLFALDRDGTARAALSDVEPRDAEVLESLVERVEVDGEEYLDLSPTGQIFHETFRERFRSERDRVLPPAVPAAQKQPPRLGHHSLINMHRDAIGRYLAAITREIPQVVQCLTYYCNPDLPEPARFRRTGDRIEGIYSDGSFTVKFWVETLATTDGQRDAVVAALGEWLDDRR